MSGPNDSDSISGVRVHRSGGGAGGIGALAYAQGADIHLAPGQEHHLPHEAWHVVQQRQGRVQPTLTLVERDGVNHLAGQRGGIAEQGLVGEGLRWGIGSAGVS